MNIADPKLETYSERHSSPEGKIFKDLARITQEKTKWPRVQGGHLEGQFLKLMVKFSRDLNRSWIAIKGS